MLHEDPPDKVETPPSADEESQLAVSMPHSQSCSLVLEAKTEVLQPPASPLGLPEALVH